MKKRILWIIGAVLALVLAATFLGPRIILSHVRQPEPEENYAYSDAFCESYDETRIRLQELSDRLGVEIFSYPIDEKDGLYIDTLYLPSTGPQTNLIVLTTGVHGIEGYIGAAMLEVFFSEIYGTLDTQDTGVVVVANVNPYGMKYYRRCNENNVDLNRNFILDWGSFDRTSNKEYPKVDTFLGPVGKIGNGLWHEVGFYLNCARTALIDGADTISDALLTGQYEYPQGVYYGGNGDEASTAYLKSVFAQCLESGYENIVHIDIHSGYGPRYDMVIFNSVHENMNEEESQKAYGYDHVIAWDSESFYATIGDTNDFFYRLAEKTQAEVNLYATCFEFGTIGDTFFDTILSLKYTIDENRNHWYPTDNAISAEILRQNYMELFYPTQTQWREKTVEDFKAAAMGVLKNKLQ